MNGMALKFSQFQISDRVSGSTGGPYELAVLMAFVFIYFLSSINVKSILGFLILIFTASRITLFAAVLTFVKKTRYYISFILAFLLIAVIISSYFMKELNVVSRYGELKDYAFGEKNIINKYFAAYHNAPLIKNQKEYFELFGDPENITREKGDASLEVRIYRQSMLLKKTLNSISTTIFGLGPSYASFAVDSNYIRVFVETGFIGLLLYALFFYKALRNKDKNIQLYSAIILITGAFIDIFTSYKVMLLFWFIYGQQIERQINSTKLLNGNKLMVGCEYQLENTDTK